MLCVAQLITRFFFVFLCVEVDYERRDNEMYQVMCMPGIENHLLSARDQDSYIRSCTSNFQVEDFILCWLMCSYYYCYFEIYEYV